MTISDAAPSILPLISSASPVSSSISITTPPSKPATTLHSVNQPDSVPPSKSKAAKHQKGRTELGLTVSSSLKNSDTVRTPKSAKKSVSTLSVDNDRDKKSEKKETRGRKKKTLVKPKTQEEERIAKDTSNITDGRSSTRPSEIVVRSNKAMDTGKSKVMVKALSASQEDQFRESGDIPRPENGDASTCSHTPLPSKSFELKSTEDESEDQVIDVTDQQDEKESVMMDQLGADLEEGLHQDAKVAFSKFVEDSEDEDGKTNPINNDPAEPFQIGAGDTRSIIKSAAWEDNLAHVIAEDLSKSVPPAVVTLDVAKSSSTLDCPTNSNDAGLINNGTVSVKETEPSSPDMQMPLAESCVTPESSNSDNTDVHESSIAPLSKIPESYVGDKDVIESADPILRPQKGQQSPVFHLAVREEASLWDLYPDINITEDLPVFVSSSSPQSAPSSGDAADSKGFGNFTICQSSPAGHFDTSSKKPIVFKRNPLSATSDQSVSYVSGAKKNLLELAGYSRSFNYSNSDLPGQLPHPLGVQFYSRHVSDTCSVLDDFFSQNLYQSCDSTAEPCVMDGGSDDSSNLSETVERFKEILKSHMNTIFPGFNSHISVEYDMDEQDEEYLNIVNEMRREAPRSQEAKNTKDSSYEVDGSHTPEATSDHSAETIDISKEVFEITMTLLEVAWNHLERRLPPKLDKKLSDVPLEVVVKVGKRKHDEMDSGPLEAENTSVRSSNEPNPAKIQVESETKENCDDKAGVVRADDAGDGNEMDSDGDLEETYHNPGVEEGCEEVQVCAVCSGEEACDSNEIVFCDGCDVGVHQECYGVAFIPEGQWRCQRCQAQLIHRKKQHNDHIHRLILAHRAKKRKVEQLNSEKDAQESSSVVNSHNSKTEQKKLPSTKLSVANISNSRKGNDTTADPQCSNFEINCILCPNTTGAFKQTDTGTWAHLSCALWIPEATVEDPDLMEPIIGVENIPESSWLLHCSICKQQSTRSTKPGHHRAELFKSGACMRCSAPNCMRAFHVTCAQKAKFYMRLNRTTVGDSSNDKPKDQDDTEVRSKLSKGVKFSPVCYCQSHTPEGHEVSESLREAMDHYAKRFATRADPTQSARRGQYSKTPKQSDPPASVTEVEPVPAIKKETEDFDGVSNLSSVKKEEGVDEDADSDFEITEEDKLYLRERHARHNKWTTLSDMPLIPHCLVAHVVVGLTHFEVPDCLEFVEAMARYWTLKREHRNGASLLSRLVSSKLKVVTDNNSIGYMSKVMTTAQLASQIVVDNSSGAHNDSELFDMSSFSLFSSFLTYPDAKTKLGQTYTLLERYSQFAEMIQQWSLVAQHNASREEQEIELTDSKMRVLMSLVVEVFNSAILPIWKTLCKVDEKHDYMELLSNNGNAAHEDDSYHAVMASFHTIRVRIESMKYFAVNELQVDIDAAIDGFQKHLENTLAEYKDQGERIKNRGEILDPETLEECDGSEGTAATAATLKETLQHIWTGIRCVSKPLSFLKKLKLLLEPVYEQAYKEERRVLYGSNVFRDYILRTAAFGRGGDGGGVKSSTPLASYPVLHDGGDSKTALVPSKSKTETIARGPGENTSKRRRLMIIGDDDEEE